MFLLFLLCDFCLANSPVLLFPGLSGSQIHYKADASSSWAQLWLDMTRTMPARIADYIPVLQANYDPKADVFSTNVFQSEPVGWGNTTGMDHMDDNMPSNTYYFHYLISALVDAGYVDGVDLFGAPFDFRLESFNSVENDNGLFANLKALIESIYKKTSKPLYVVSHGEAAAVLRHFFAHYVDATWKSTNIQGWISASGSFAGSPVALQFLISYKGWIIPTLNGEQTHDILQLYSALYWSLPTVYAFPKDYLLAQVNTDTTSFNITIENITQAFTQSVGEPAATAAQNFVSKLNAEFDPPNVDLFYYYGTGIDTVSYETYQGDDATWWQQEGTESYTDGDGLIPTESATAPEQWASGSKTRIQGVELPSVSSQDILSSADFISDVITIVTAGSWDRNPTRLVYELKQKSVRSFLQHAKSLEQNLTAVLTANRQRVRAEFMAKRAQEKAKGERREGFKGKKEEFSQIKQVGQKAIISGLSQLVEIYTIAENTATVAARVLASTDQPMVGMSELAVVLEAHAAQTMTRLDAQRDAVAQAATKMADEIIALVRRE